MVWQRKFSYRKPVQQLFINESESKLLSHRIAIDIMFASCEHVIKCNVQLFSFFRTTIFYETERMAFT